jgi:hypothetical protein
MAFVLVLKFAITITHTFKKNNSLFLQKRIFIRRNVSQENYTVRKDADSQVGLQKMKSCINCMEFTAGYKS